MPKLDPARLLRIRDGVYAADLLIVAVAELDLFGWLDTRGPIHEEQLREEFGLAARPCDVMVTYLVALGLLKRDPHQGIAVTELGATFLSPRSRSDLGPYFASLRERPACAELLHVLRSGEPVAWASAGGSKDWTGRLDDPEFARRITAAMDARGAALASACAAALKDLPYASALDLGGGSGVYARALLEQRPGLRAAVLERPPVDDAARTILRELAEDRLDVISGDMFDSVPTGFDLHLFSHVLHDWGEEQVRELLKGSFAALPPGGWLIDHDTHIDASKSGPLPVAEYSVLLMHSTHGKCWSTSELAALLRDTGFVVHDHRPTAADRAALIALKPD
jgi:hypothetical protein